MFRVRILSSCCHSLSFPYPLGPCHHLILLSSIAVVGLPFPVHLAAVTYLPLGSWDTLAQNIFGDSHVACNICDFQAWHSRFPILGSQRGSLWSFLYEYVHVQPLPVLAIPWDRHQRSHVCAFVHVTPDHSLTLSPLQPPSPFQPPLPPSQLLSSLPDSPMGFDCAFLYSCTLHICCHRLPYIAVRCECNDSRMLSTSYDVCM